MTDMLNKVMARVIQPADVASSFQTRQVSPAETVVVSPRGLEQPLPASGSDLPPASTEMEKAEVTQAVERLKDFVQSIQRKLEFSVDDGTGRIVVKIMDADTGDTIRQIPAEVVLRLAQNLGDESSGLFVKLKA